MDDYEKLLEKGIKKLPKDIKEEGRFSLPLIRAEKSGAKTIILNIMEVASALRREIQHLVKFLLKELIAEEIISSSNKVISRPSSSSFEITSSRTTETQGNN